MKIISIIILLLTSSCGTLLSISGDYSRRTKDVEVIRAGLIIPLDNFVPKK